MLLRFVLLVNMDKNIMKFWRRIIKMNPRLQMRFYSKKHRQEFTQMIDRMGVYRDDGALLGPSVEMLYGNRRNKRKE